ncbi:hypothetical protein AB0K60_19500 [Thermopolyspora sp. NPDC052614]
MIGGPEFLSHMAYIASPDRLRNDDPPIVEDDQETAGEALAEQFGEPDGP